MADNSIPKYTAPTKGESEDAAGITQFPDETSWNHTNNGLILQGGKTPGPIGVRFSVPYRKQLLGVFVSSGAINGETAEGFTATAACYWWAVGV